MHLLRFLVGCVLCGCGVTASGGVLSSTILSGPMFFVIGVNTTDDDVTGHSILMVTNETNGVPLNGPELRVVANTTVYFNITGIFTQAGDYYFPVAFGLTRNSSAPAPGDGLDGDALGLSPTPASVSAGACYSYVVNEQPLDANGASHWGHVRPNTFGLNYTTDGDHAPASTGYRYWSTTACVLQWQVPANATETNTNYYYFEPFRPSTPRRIHILASDPNTPSTGSGSGSGTGSGSGSGSNNNSTSTTTAPPTTNGTTAPTGTGSSSPTPTGTGTSSSTGSKTPSSAFASAHLSGWAGIPLVAALAAAAL